MKKICGLFIPFMILGCTQKIYEATRWQNEQIDIDGKTKEWSIPLKYFDNTSQLNYEFSNDLENLYFAVRTTDKAAIQQILMSGIKLEIDTAGQGKEYPFGFCYPVNNRPLGTRPPGDGNVEEERAMPPDFQQKPDFQNRDRGEPHFDNIRLYGFSGIQKPGKVVKLSGSEGINANLSVDNFEVLFLEAQIPLNTFYDKQITALDTNHVFTFKIILESMGMQMPGIGSNGPNDSERGEGPPMGGGPDRNGPPPGMANGAGGMGGGPGMVGGPHSMNQSPANAEESIIIQKLHLSSE